MSTRCYIGVVLENGEVEYIYSHWDGYIEGVGATLLNYHNTYEKVKLLVSFGDASSIYENTMPEPGQEHSYENPVEGVSIYYHRDRDEDWETVGTRTAKTEKDFWNSRGMWIEYLYLFKDGKWFVSGHDGEVQELSVALENSLKENK